MRTVNSQKIASYINALRPIIYIHHFDFQVVDELIKSAGKNFKLFEYNEAAHWVDFDTKAPRQDFTLAEFLSSFDTFEPKKIFLVLKDVHKQLDNPVIIARLKSIAQKTMFTDNFYVTVFLVCSELVLPPELEKMITLFEIPYPTQTEIADIIKDYAEGFHIPLDNETLNELTVSFKGLSDFEIRQILNLAYQQTGMIRREDNALVLKEKEQIIKKSGIIEILSFNSSMNDVGGLDNLKKYLENKAYIFNNLGKAREFGIDLPKGILIVGMPGCGKSLTAKATATKFNAPLLRLDVGKLMGKYIGESEGNLARALKTAEAVAPCVLWIDELEKAFAGVGGTGGGSDVTTRLFGQFLTWLQEKESSVYVVATSNDISILPPEFLRKGRFDELFMVELPDAEERRKIFEIHLKKRNQLSKEVDVLKLLKPSEGYSGADIEALVKETVEKTFINGGRKVTTGDLLETLKITKSISVTMESKIKELKEKLSTFNFKKANS